MTHDRNGFLTRLITFIDMNLSSSTLARLEIDATDFTELYPVFAILHKSTLPALTTLRLNLCHGGNGFPIFYHDHYAEDPDEELTDEVFRQRFPSLRTVQAIMCNGDPDDLDGLWEGTAQQSRLLTIAGEMGILALMVGEFES
jgi:hypothetical protein